MVWFGNRTAQAKSKLARLVKIAMKTIGKKEHQSFESLYKRSVLREAHQILAEALHFYYYELLLCIVAFIVYGPNLLSM